MPDTPLFGRRYKQLLDEARDRQLTGELTTRDAAMTWLRNELSPRAPLIHGSFTRGSRA